ncbi:MAG: ThiF family adenylyltransferase, partial [Actinobacteria bacterium]|nr:ThiF family adenylyltransferase [Actinomycetota bacterium]
GVPYSTPGTPTVVVREALDLGNLDYRKRWLQGRSSTRLDLVREPQQGDLEVPVIPLPGQLSFGIGATLDDLRDNVARLTKEAATQVLSRIEDTIRRSAVGSAQYFVLAVPRPKQSGTEDVHLIAGRISGEEADRVRSTNQSKRTMTSVVGETEIQWCTVSDERDLRITRRDVRRPVTSFKGKTIVLWGCGGLGTWIGEFLARAGAKKIVLADPGMVMGGLLVRQNFDEEDIGAAKAVALRKRIASINDRVEVVVGPDFTTIIASGDLPVCDILIDATINRSVGAAISSVWSKSRGRPLIARLCTDRSTSTLGLMTVARPGSEADLGDLDVRAGRTVQNNAELEPYRCFWEEPSQGDEVVPEPGCSIPTFHGSAADLAAIAGVLVSLLGQHIDVENPGTHLVGLPHGPGATVPHRWISEGT